MDYLNRVFLMGAARNLLAGRQIQAVTGALRDAGIPSILLKGHALARTVYPDPALRQSSDIDLLVRPADIPAAEQVLEKLGYVCPVKTYRISQHEYHHEIFTLPKNGLPVELHWSVDNAFDLFPENWLDAAFSRRISLDSGDLSCDTLCHPDHLLFLTFHHVFQHGSMRLDWVCDISRVLQSDMAEENWEDLGRYAVDLHIRKPLELALAAAGHWTGCTIPQACGNFSSWPAAHERENRLIRFSRTRHSSVISSAYLSFQGQPGLSGKFLFGWHFVFPPVPMMAKFRKSPSAADIPLAYLRRWFTIVKYI
jgi:hypothetical protein